MEGGRELKKKDVVYCSLLSTTARAKGIINKETGSTSTVTKRYDVNLCEKTCSCNFVHTHPLPCEHVITAYDHMELRDSVDLRETFRK